ncbi:MAG: hypothetical protein COT74_05570 [Bdellovibrionales bacterium CG10_big_fil_rev_8_21_14_0_10_45_34]|nr:MAG: hypothetical protein COT74_05570 [Bdellovibrionales bacterium CG10_big_fil_rev_8_21_14_0_10_45_34]
MKKEINPTDRLEPDFRTFLQKELLNRCRKNPNYSLRSFAKSLSISPSALSAMLNSKRSITPKMKLRLGTNLGLQREEVLEMIALQDGGQWHERQRLQLDTFAVISDWYHYAILELTHVQGFKGDPKWISCKLGITKSEVNIACERLVNLGLLEITSDHQWKDTSENGFITNAYDELTTAASKKLQKQMLELSIRALMELPLHSRSHSSITMAIDPDDLPEAKEKIKRFRRDLCSYFEKKKKRKQVFNLSIGLYPISKESEEA